MKQLFAHYRDPRWAWDLFEPYVDCITKDRVGRRGDGGKWLCDVRLAIASRKPKPCIVYSFGVSDDVSQLFLLHFIVSISFETDFNQQFGCHTFSFDPSSHTKELHTPNLKPNMSIYDVGIGPVWEPLFGKGGT